MKKYKMLVVDDENLICWSLSSNFSKKGYEVITAETGEKGFKAFTDENPDIVLLDIKLPDTNGIEVLKKIKSTNLETQVIMMTAYGEVKTAVETMKLGAYYYVTKPFNLDEINIIVERALERMDLQTEVSKIKKEKIRIYSFNNVIGKSKKIEELIELCKKIVNSNTSTILIQGESGVGKDFFAKIIHFESSRKNKPFVEINCASIPDNLLESELFGYEKGSFTDAKQSKNGLFELADTGTIFLNEIGDMSSQVQAKVLKLIEDKTFRRIGGIKDIEVDVRIITATNKDLKALKEDGKFREDLYFRINVLPVYIPSLRERSDDIILLFEYFLKEYCDELRIRKIPVITEETKQILIKYRWQGNVRELKNIVERILILNGSKNITPAVLPDEIKNIVSDNLFGIKIPDSGIVLDDLEKEIIITALNRCDGNQIKAAKLIGLTRDTLRYRIEKFEIKLD